MSTGADEPPTWPHPRARIWAVRVRSGRLHYALNVNSSRVDTLCNRYVSPIDVWQAVEPSPGACPACLLRATAPSAS